MALARFAKLTEEPTLSLTLKDLGIDAKDGVSSQGVFEQFKKTVLYDFFQEINKQFERTEDGSDVLRVIDALIKVLVDGSSNAEKLLEAEKNLFLKLKIYFGRIPSQLDQDQRRVFADLFYKTAKITGYQPRVLTVGEIQVLVKNYNEDNPDEKINSKSPSLQELNKILWHFGQPELINYILLNNQVLESEPSHSSQENPIIILGPTTELDKLNDIIADTSLCDFPKPLLDFLKKSQESKENKTIEKILATTSYPIKLTRPEKLVVNGLLKNKLKETLKAFLDSEVADYSIVSGFKAQQSYFANMVSEENNIFRLDDDLINLLDHLASALDVIIGLIKSTKDTICKNTLIISAESLYQSYLFICDTFDKSYRKERFIKEYEPKIKNAKKDDRFTQVTTFGNTQRHQITSEFLIEKIGSTQIPEAIDTLALNLKDSGMVITSGRPRFSKRQSEVKYELFEITGHGKKTPFTLPEGENTKTLISNQTIREQQSSFKIYYDSSVFGESEIIDHLAFDDPEKQLGAFPLHYEKAPFRCAASKASIIYQVSNDSKDSKPKGEFLENPIEITLVNSTAINLAGVEINRYTQPSKNKRLDEEKFKQAFRKIITLQLEAFRDQGCKHLVLCGLGDGRYKGGYGEYSQLVASIYCELLSSGNYSFESVSFAAPPLNDSTLYQDLRKAFAQFESQEMTVNITTSSINHLAITLHNQGKQNIGMSNAGDHMLVPGCYWYYGDLALDEQTGVVTNMVMIQDPQLNPRYFSNQWRPINCAQYAILDSKEKNEFNAQTTEEQQKNYIKNLCAEIGSTRAQIPVEHKKEKIDLMLERLSSGAIEDKKALVEVKPNPKVSVEVKPNPNTKAYRAKRKLMILNDIYLDMKKNKKDYFSQQKEHGLFGKSSSDYAKRPNMQLLRKLFLKELKNYVSSANPIDTEFLDQCEARRFFDKSQASTLLIPVMLFLCVPISPIIALLWVVSKIYSMSTDKKPPKAPPKIK